MVTPKIKVTNDMAGRHVSHGVSLKGVFVGRKLVNVLDGLTFGLLIFVSWSKSYFFTCSEPVEMTTKFLTCLKSVSNYLKSNHLRRSYLKSSHLCSNYSEPESESQSNFDSNSVSDFHSYSESDFKLVFMILIIFIFFILYLHSSK